MIIILGHRAYCSSNTWTTILAIVVGYSWSVTVSNTRIKSQLPDFAFCWCGHTEHTVARSHVLLCVQSQRCKGSTHLGYSANWVSLYCLLRAMTIVYCTLYFHHGPNKSIDCRKWILIDVCRQFVSIESTKLVYLCILTIYCALHDEDSVHQRFRCLHHILPSATMGLLTISDFKAKCAVNLNVYAIRDYQARNLSLAVTGDFLETSMIPLYAF